MFGDQKTSPKAKRQNNIAIASVKFYVVTPMTVAGQAIIVPKRQILA